MSDHNYLEEDVQRIIKDFEDEMKIVEEERDKKIRAERGELLIGELLSTLPAIASIDVVMRDAVTVEERIAEIEQAAADHIDVLESIRDEMITNTRFFYDGYSE